MSSSTTVIFVVALATLATVSSAFDGARLRDLPITCAHGGQLVEGKCECTLNWSGASCEDEVCQNGGRPHTNSEGSVKCSCPYGLKGLRCEQVTECGAHGKLVDGKCVCEAGFVGVFCSTRPCHNGAPTLIPGAEEYTCTCDIGFTGSFCEEVLQCLNGGSVSSSNECECAHGFTGEICNQCEHIVENGECIPEVSEMSLATTSSTSSLEWQHFAIIGGIMLVVILVACSIYFVLRSRTKPSRVSSAQGSAIVPNPEGTDV